MEKNIHSAYHAHERVQQSPGGTSLAQQSFRDECDINTIMTKYYETGLLSHVKEHQGSYGDFLSAVEYHDAANMVIEAQNAFKSLTSKIRNRFHNSPEEFLAFVQDDENEAEMRELGLLQELPREDKLAEALADALGSDEITKDPAGPDDSEETSEEP